MNVLSGLTGGTMSSCANCGQRLRALPMTTWKACGRPIPRFPRSSTTGLKTLGAFCLPLLMPLGVFGRKKRATRSSVHFDAELRRRTQQRIAQLQLALIHERKPLTRQRISAELQQVQAMLQEIATVQRALVRSGRQSRNRRRV
jgi:hypothetical protein